MSVLRLLCPVFLCCMPFVASAQLVVREPSPPPAVANPADTVQYPRGGTNCNNTLADYGARTVLRAIDSCPFTFFASRQAYYSYAKQAILGIAVPGATEAAGALALEKAGENAFFCITGALIDSSSSNDTDKAFLKALLAEVKENVDRASFATSLAKLRQGLIDKGAVYLQDGEVQTFIKTLDATLTERYDAYVTGELTLAEAGEVRFDSPEDGARRLREKAEGLARECRYAQAADTLARALQMHLDHLLMLRLEVSKAKHARYCLDVSAAAQRGGPLGSDSPFLRNSQRNADADIAEAMRHDAEYTQVIAEFASYQQSVQARRNDVELLKQRATRQLDAARKAAGDCDWASADSTLAQLADESLSCAVELDAQRRAREELARQIEQAKQQFAQLEIEHEKIIATPFSQISSCGELSLVADTFDAIPGRCRELSNLESKVAALRNRARACADFKTAEQIQGGVGTPTVALSGKVTVSPEIYEDHGAGSYIRTTYAPNSATYDRVDARNQLRAMIVWNYNGVPGSLSAGQAVTITVTGGVASESPKGAADGLVFAGAVAIYGDVTLKTAQQADRGHATGLYEFVVNANPQNVEIHLGGSPVGTGIIWKYSK